jgi:hypothetical protein
MPIKLKELPPILVRNYMSGTNTFIRSKPALGKTKSIESFITTMQKRIDGFKGWMFYAPTMSPMDIQASAPNDETGTLKLYNNEALPNHYNDPDAKGVLFIDELPNADPATVKLLQKYVNGEDMSGVLRKPVGVMVVAAGNRIEDKSSVQQQGRAFLSRFEQLEAYSDAQDNIDYAAKQAWHPNVQTFFKDHPASIDNYDEVFETRSSAGNRGQQAQQANGQDKLSEEGKLGIWANMRSWERISRKEYAADELASPVSLAEAVGNLGSGVGAAYEAHKKMLNQLVSFDAIMHDPQGVDLPTQMDQQYALSMVVALKCSEDQMPAVKQFGERLPLELQAAILRNLSVRKNFALATAQGYTDWITNPKLSKLLNGR